jgi:CBS domain-containing protein
MAPRAAARLVSLGFRKVFEYKAGKEDWLAAGLPAEGRTAGEPTIAAVTRRDVPRFGLHELAGDILESLTANGWEWGAIVNSSGILLGRVRASEIKDPAATAADMLEEGPGTYRPNVPLDELLGRMLDKRFDLAFVTDPDGRLQGLVSRRDIAHALQARRKASWVLGVNSIVL